MNIYDATEQAYKNGYQQGKQDAVKHGYWEQLDEEHFNCTQCATVFEKEKETTMYTIHKLWRYCSRCGAKMDLPEPYNPDIPRDQWEDRAKFDD